VGCLALWAEAMGPQNVNAQEVTVSSMTIEQSATVSDTYTI
jgi:hypothetical protein